MTYHLGQGPHLLIWRDERRLDQKLVLALGVGRGLSSQWLQQDCTSAFHLTA